MRLQIDDTWRISSTETCWQVERFAGVYRSGRRADQPRYKAVGYHSSLGSAVRALADQAIREADTATLREAIAAVEKIAQRIEAALDGLKKPYELVRRQTSRATGDNSTEGKTQ